MIDDFSWDGVQRHFHAFWMINGSVQVHVGDVCCHVTSVPCGEHMVPVKLDCFNVSCLSDAIPWDDGQGNSVCYTQNGCKLFIVNIILRSEQSRRKSFVDIFCVSCTNGMC